MPSLPNFLPKHSKNLAKPLPEKVGDKRRPVRGEALEAAAARGLHPEMACNVNGKMGPSIACSSSCLASAVRKELHVGKMEENCMPNALNDLL